MSSNGHLPTTWWVVAEWYKSPGEVITKHLEKATARLGGPPSHVMLHPATLAALGVESMETQENGRRCTVATWRGLQVLAVERRGRRGPVSQVQPHDFWFGRNGEEGSE
jgi:hypothetical protein